MQRAKQGDDSGRPQAQELRALIEAAVGPHLDSLSRASREAKESCRLLEIAQGAGAGEAADALDAALRHLRAATGNP